MQQSKVKMVYLFNVLQSSKQLRFERKKKNEEEEEIYLFMIDKKLSELLRNDKINTKNMK